MSTQVSSERQRTILAFIRKSIRDRGYAPSIREIAEAVGLRSSASVYHYLKQLEHTGAIRRTSTLARSIELNDLASTIERGVVSVPILGRVAAGQPLLAEGNVEGYRALPLDVAGPDEAFLLRIHGDSMVGAGILDGDEVLVRQRDAAEVGSIVVALTEDGATVKTLRRDAQGYFLEASNPAYAPIRSDRLRILGQVVGLWRSL